MAEAVWDGERDEVDIDSAIDAALEANEDELLLGLLDELVGLVQFQGRHREAAEFRAFVPGLTAFARGDYHNALFLFTQELNIEAIEPGLLLDKLLLWLGHRLEDVGAQYVALWAFTECEDEDADEAEERLREVLGLDDYSSEVRWNEAIFAHYEALVLEQPENAGAWEVLALQHSLLDQPDEALAAAKTTLSLDPTRQAALQVPIEILGERGDPDSLNALEAQIKVILEASPDVAWPHFAMAEFLYLHRDDPKAAQGHCARALAIEPTHEDANDLCCMILHKLHQWDALVSQLEAMIARGEDRFQLYDLYDDLSEILRQQIGDQAKADAAQERAALYHDAWLAGDHVLEVFRKDPANRHTWRVLRALLHETLRWDLLFQSALERLDHETDHGQIHEIYEGLFVVFQARMAIPPWAVLEAHLQERVDEEESPALRLLLSHHLDWVTDQLRAEEEAEAEEGDLSGESRVDASSLEVSQEEAQAFARKWAFFDGHPWFARRRTLSVGLFLLGLPIVWVSVQEATGRPWAQAAALVLGLFFFWLAHSLLHGMMAPKGARCVLCDGEELDFQRLSLRAPVYQWAKAPGKQVPHWGRCRNCGFDSRLVYQPVSSGPVRLLCTLQDAQGDCAYLNAVLAELLEGEGEAHVDLLSTLVAVWEALYICKDSRPEIFEALQTLLLKDLPILAHLLPDAADLLAFWAAEEPVEATKEELAQWEGLLSASPADRRTSQQAIAAFEELLALHIGHLREKILQAKVSSSTKS